MLELVQAGPTAHVRAVPLIKDRRCNQVTELSFPAASELRDVWGISSGSSLPGKAEAGRNLFLSIAHLVSALEEPGFAFGSICVQDPCFSQE